MSTLTRPVHRASVFIGRNENVCIRYMHRVRINKKHPIANIATSTWHLAMVSPMNIGVSSEPRLRRLPMTRRSLLAQSICTGNSYCAILSSAVMLHVRQAIDNHAEIAVAEIRSRDQMLALRRQALVTELAEPGKCLDRHRLGRMGGEGDQDTNKRKMPNIKNKHDTFFFRLYGYV
ncbi:MAG: hypothetical protein IPH43_07005 [Xanthomonadales bacterium]|nr:hypothetical protein [Xanthomonadales bacterium]